MGSSSYMLADQRVSCKTPTKRGTRGQRVTAKKQNEFESHGYSVYEGRRLCGRFVEIAPSVYVACDAADRLLGEFSALTEAYAAAASVMVGGAQ